MTENKEFDLICQFESECQNYAKSIILRICKNAIKVINKQEAKLAGSTDDYPTNFNFFDILSVELQDRSYDEINPYLEDFVENTLDVEYDKISGIEKLVLEYSECSERSECDIEKVKSNIYSQFHIMMNEHYCLRKIQNYIDRL
jgi:hypothetical protein